MSPRFSLYFKTLFISLFLSLCGCGGGDDEGGGEGGGEGAPEETSSEQSSSSGGGFFSSKSKNRMDGIEIKGFYLGMSPQELLKNSQERFKYKNISMKVKGSDVTVFYPVERQRTHNECDDLANESFANEADNRCRALAEKTAEYIQNKCWDELDEKRIEIIKQCRTEMVPDYKPILMATNSEEHGLISITTIDHNAVLSLWNNSTLLTDEHFVQAFINGYGIPEMKPISYTSSGEVARWSYNDIEDGYEIILLTGNFIMSRTDEFDGATFD